MHPSWLLLCVLLWVGHAAAAALTEFAPQGEQLEVRQAHARFATPMVSAGLPDAPAPLLAECAAGGQGRWLDERTWVYDLATPLAAGEPCRFRPRADLRDLAGAAVAAADEYAFHVAGPRVLWSLPMPGDAIDEDQVFVLRLNGSAQAHSIEALARCEVQGIHEQIDVRRLTGAERARVLQDLDQRLRAREAAGQAAAPVDDDRLEVLQCRRTLPAQARLALVWGTGIAAPAGFTNPADQRLEFQVRKHFTARLRCQREHARAGCLPLTPLRLEFSAPVARALLERIELRDAQGRRLARRAVTADHDTEVRFDGPFPAGTTLRLSLPAELRDDKGRMLINARRFPLSVRIAEHPPLVKFAGDFGILERVAGGVLPLTVRNLEDDGAGGTSARVRWLRVTDEAAMLDWMARVRRFEQPPPARPDALPPDARARRLLTADLPGLHDRPLPKPLGAQAFEVIGVPLAQPGFYVVEAESRWLGRALLGAAQPMYVRTTALVTNLAVHFKWSAGTSLAWVTRLDLGTPQAGARIGVRDCRGKLLAEGVGDRHGMALLRGLPDPREAAYDCPLLISARHGDDLGFVRSDWDEGIEPWRFNLPVAWQAETRLAHSVLDRVLFRPGETVHMRHFLRDRRDAGLTVPHRLPRTLRIEHAASQQRWFLPLHWDNGAAASTWTIPAGARRGDYTLRLIERAIDDQADPVQLEYLDGLDSGAFSVGDFRVPLMQAAIDPTQPRLVGADRPVFDVGVSYLNGGGARHLPMKLRGRLEPRWHVTFAGYPDFAFAQRGDDEQGAEEGDGIDLAPRELTLDAGGAARVALEAPPARVLPHDLRVELEYADPVGEIQTVTRVQPWWPAAVVVGMKQQDWVRAGQRPMLRFQVADLDGRPVAGAPVEVTLALRQTFSHRVRLAGGFYGYRHESRVTPLPAGCSGTSDARGAYTCQVGAEQGGEVLVRVTARDAAGRVARSTHSLWVAGKDDWWFRQDNHDRIDLIPEKKLYQPGERARLQVRMPYRQATALVTVEGEGIMDARVVRLSGQAPVIELPVQAGWAPNVFVSALVVRGRNDAVKPGALVDLGRPAFKLGIAPLRVDQREHRLHVEVKPQHTRYQARDNARVDLRVRTAEGLPPPADTELIVVAVDEGLLELAPNHSWKLLQAMMAERGYGLRTVTAQMQVTGKRHFGRKALPSGGGGGKLPTRELFDTLLFWRDGIRPDAHGDARVDIPLNDSLTAFRIVAVAASANRFGSGDARIHATRDLQLIAGLAPLLREGDHTQARFTLRNGSDRAMRIRVEAQAEGLAPLARKEAQLAPGDSRELTWPVQVPDGIGRLRWQLTAREADGPAHDALRITQPVQPAVPLRVQSAQLQRLERPLRIPVAAPDGAVRAELRATLAASLIDGQSALREHMRRYPYTCLEQRASMAVATRDAALWRQVADTLPTHLADTGLATFFPGSGDGSVALTAYLLQLADAAGWALPADARARMLRALGDHVAGRLPAANAAWRDRRAAEAERLAALAALARAGLATPELIATLQPQARLWPTSMLLDWLTVLRHGPELAQRDAWRRDALAALEARVRLGGRKLGFADESGDALWWMMASADANAARALLYLLDEPAWRLRVPALTAGLLARQQAGRWSTTTANAWGVLALEGYRARFEQQPPTGRSYAVLDSEGRVVDWAQSPRGATAFLPLPTTSSTLVLRHEGQGAPHVVISTLAALPTRAPVQRGYGVTRELLAIDRRAPDRWRRGDVLRVRLTIDARDDMGWVVLEDPVPAGAGILGGAGARDSALLARGAAGSGAWPAWREHRHDAFLAYFDYLPRGRHVVEYTLRLNGDGRFNLPPTRIEAMYAPELHGAFPNPPFVIEP
jgi:uncharacterized protein YfaS (alpha-2-macroglobulin family)